MKRYNKQITSLLLGLLFLPSVEVFIPQPTGLTSLPTTRHSLRVVSDVEIPDTLPLHQPKATSESSHGSKHPDFIQPEPVTLPVVASEKAVVAEQQPTTPQTPTQLDGWFDEYAKAFGVEKRKLMAIAKCESHFNPGAVNGPYGGMFQYSASTWRSTRNSMGLDPDPALRFNAKESIHTTAFKIAHGGIGAWPVCGAR